MLRVTSAHEHTVSRADIPQTAKEGDTLIFQIDKGTTDKRKERIEKKMNKLFKD
jgi:hypothetical protein